MSEMIPESLPDDFGDPEFGFETARLTIVGYVRKDGTHGYAVAAKGDSPATTYLGLTIVAQDRIKEWGNT